MVGPYYELAFLILPFTTIEKVFSCKSTLGSMWHYGLYAMMHSQVFIKAISSAKFLATAINRAAMEALLGVHSLVMPDHLAPPGKHTVAQVTAGSRGIGQGRGSSQRGQGRQRGHCG